jgi:tRNA (adenine37-N6)-methyltransferase
LRSSRRRRPTQASFSSGLSGHPGRRGCKRRAWGAPTGRVCRIEVYEPWIAALDGVDRFERLEVLYWLHESRRDLVRQSPANDGTTYGTFALRTPARPNPIGTSIATLVSRDGAILNMRGLDCLDGTPLLDLKPDRTLFTPIAPPQPGDFETS